MQIQLDDVAEVLDNGIRPLARHPLLRLQFNAHAARRLGVRRLVRHVDVVLAKAGTALAPPSRESDAYRIENGSLPSVVRTDEHSGVAEIDDDVPNRPEILDLDPRYAHVQPLGRSTTHTVMAPPISDLAQPHFTSAVEALDPRSQRRPLSGRGARERG